MRRSNLLARHEIASHKPLAKTHSRKMKRTFDFLFSAFFLLILSPVFLLIALLIKLDSPGPVFYRAVRVGKKGEPFRLYKFRSMAAGAAVKGPGITHQGDPRVTWVGNWLRRFKLDELPQLINVLVGDMSLVGPRPEVKKFSDMYTNEEMAILSVRPGITDWASIWNPDEGSILAGSTDPDRDYLEKIRPEKIRLQLKYVREQSFWTDLKIIFLTLTTILFK